MFQSYTDVLEYLYRQLPMYSRIGAAAYKEDLDNTLAICKVLGNPEEDQKFVHIAGTNGKGSTSHMIAAVLQCAGYKTGLYTSPHLKDFRERIRVNGAKIETDYVTDFVNQYKQPFEAIEPSFFEWTVGLAFKYFQDLGTDIAVIETGLGGRLDSTNVITPLLSVITNIGYDHTDMLGDTLPKIAAEKAGIIKQGIPVVIGETNDETKHVFMDKAREMEAEITFADNIYKAQKEAENVNNLICHIYKENQPASIHLELELKGSYQLKNVCTVLAAVDRLKTLGLNIPMTAIYKGLAETTRLTGLHGRWDILQRDPLVVADIAHNKDGIEQLLESVKNTRFSKLHIVLGFVREKEIGPILTLMPQNAVYYFTEPTVPRHLPKEDLKKQALAAGLQGELYDNVNAALGAALKNSQTDDMILICGSNFVVADLNGLS